MGYPAISAAVTFCDPIKDATGSNFHIGSRHTDISRFSQAIPEISPLLRMYQNYAMITFFIIVSNLSLYQLLHMLRGTDCVINMFRQESHKTQMKF